MLSVRRSLHPQSLPSWPLILRRPFSQRASRPRERQVVQPLQRAIHLHVDDSLQSTNSKYMNDMYTAWREDPSSVHKSWQSFFEATANGPASSDYSLLPDISTKPAPWPVGDLPNSPTKSHVVKEPQPTPPESAYGQAQLERLVRAFQEHGHKVAETNPLKSARKQNTADLFNLGLYGFTESDLDRKFKLGAHVLPHFAKDESSLSLREIIEHCKSTYCGSIGAEYLYVETSEESEWIQERIETPQPYTFPPEGKKRILDRLVWATVFEKFMASKFPNAKRFGLEGVESQLPAVKAVIDTSAENGVRDIIFACCHRGKLNMLSNVTRKPNELIFQEFSPGSMSRLGIEGDVKYHLGMTYERETPSGRKVNINILPNPSHLEATNPLAQGMARAIQQQNGDDRGSTMVFNSHTDASFAGQGVIYETLGLSGLKSYETGGTVHLIVNNQVGFTTDPESARTSSYVSDIAKSISAPVFHVNAEDVEAVVFVCKLAAEYRAKFRKDCWVDLICYRKNGHNEMDQPSFTQPLMYREIAEKVPHLDIYRKKLISEGVISQEDVQNMEAEVWSKLSESLARKDEHGPLDREYLTLPWKDMKTPGELRCEVLPDSPTPIAEDDVSKVAAKLGLPEEPFTVHKSLARILQKRQQSLLDGKGIDWATAEALAMGSLCTEGHHVRVSGQDVERGTFSQRHAVLHDQNTGEKYLPLDNLTPDQARFTIGNSSLSEYGVMGFDYGYSTQHPNALVMWEAQFGDFANNAQCVIDQFVSSAENKWLLRSGLVLSLPHGFDGQGPEHSSARMERFLQLCHEDARFFPTPNQLERQHQDTNIQVVSMTTPANLFHVLRRQLHREFRKPLIIFFSKSLLRHPMVKSDIADFIGKSKFQPLIPDPELGKSTSDRNGIKRVIYCTGQVYMALAKHRETSGITDTAIVRIEELHPFPWQQVKDDLEQYPNASDIVWCQEESLNDGAWSFARTRLETIFDSKDIHRGRRLRFAGRSATPSVATGFLEEHKAQEAVLLREAFEQT